MTAQRHVIVSTDMEKRETYFLNNITGVKLVIRIEGNIATLISEKITEADVRRTFEQDSQDISHLKTKNPTSSEIELFKIFIEQFIKQHNLFDGKIKKFR